MENLTIREAKVDDIDFVIETIFESEKSSSDVVSSCRIFSVSTDQFKEILTDILSQNLPNYDYYLSGFLVAEKEGEYVGALGSWLEGAEGTPSGIIKATVLLPFLNRKEIKEVSKNTKIAKGLSLNRDPNTLQLEHGYVRPAFRRQGVFTSLIKENIKRNISLHPGFEKVQGILFKENYKSYNAHIKIGYQVIEEKTVEDPEIYNFFPYNTKVLLELDKGIFSKF